MVYERDVSQYPNCSFSAMTTCTNDCEPAAQCGERECCGPGTKCEDGCCTLFPPDAGIADAGIEDAFGVDGG